VLQTLLGRTISWRSGARGDVGTGWGEAIRVHGPATLLALAWGTGLYALHPGYLLWLAPILGALLLSVPVSVLASRVSWGERARRLGLLWTPEEVDPPRELRELGQELAAETQRAERVPPSERGILRAIVEPFANAVHRSLLRGPRSQRASIRAARRVLGERLLRDGPDSLSAGEQRVLLADPEQMAELHERIWTGPLRPTHDGASTRDR